MSARKLRRKPNKKGKKKKEKVVTVLLFVFIFAGSLLFPFTEQQCSHLFADRLQGRGKSFSLAALPRCDLKSWPVQLTHHQHTGREVSTQASLKILQRGAFYCVCL